MDDDQSQWGSFGMLSLKCLRCKVPPTANVLHAAPPPLYPIAPSVEHRSSTCHSSDQSTV